jgi:RHS repeat-associated protein
LGDAGQYTDAETGFQCLRARYYDPATGQFLTRDPLLQTTRTAYVYVANNPLNDVDPSGQGVRECVYGTVVCLAVAPVLDPNGPPLTCLNRTHQARWSQDQGRRRGGPNRSPTTVTIDAEPVA